MENKIENPPAFPHEHINSDGTRQHIEGMTMWDYFAAKAPEVPAWFRVKYDYPTDVPARELGEHFESEQRFFKWRIYYANTMLRVRIQQPEETGTDTTREGREKV